MEIFEYLNMVRETPAWDRMPAISDAELDAMINILHLMRKCRLKSSHHLRSE